MGHGIMKGMLLAAGVVLALAGAVPVAGQAAEGELYGRVVDRHGAPVSGATIRLTGAGAGERAAVTGPSGRFRMRAPAGRWTVRVEALGYGGEPREVMVGAETEPITLTVDAAPVALESLRVLATVRGSRAASSLPVKIEVVDGREIERQQTLAANPTELLANVIPSFSPGRQKLTSYGESFRGRRPLYLVDGVPQSNPLRDGRRDGFTVGLDVIERVEVVFGANALQGLGATGGIVNFITMDPPVSGDLEQRASLTTTSSDEFDGDGLGWGVHYSAAKRIGSVDVLGSVSWDRRGLQFDAEGRAIAIDNVQGDIADSESRALFGKVGWAPSPVQRVEVMVSDFELAQQGGFASVAGDRERGLPAVSVPGDPEGVQPINDVTTASLGYDHEEVVGGALSAKLYYQDFAALYGGGSYGIFQDPAYAPVGDLFDQSENNSEKLGTRLTWSASEPGGAPVSLVTGVDFLRDRTYQRLVQTDRNWVPETTFRNYAPFVQADVDPVGWLTLSGGVRWELAQLDVPGFTTLAGNRSDLEPVRVEGGSPGFDEPLFNVGAVITPVPGLRLYGTLAQAFTMPDVGRVLRGVSEPGTAVEDFLDLQPIETDNVEVGISWGTGVSAASLTWFSSESELGSRLVPNEDGIYQVRRQPVRTRGWEATGRVDPSDVLSLTAAYSVLEGRYDADDDGTFDTDLGAADIGPDRFNLGATLFPAGRVSGRIQAFHYFDRDFHDADDVVVSSFDGYTTVDASLSGRLGLATVTLSVANLLDEQYITYYGQAGTDRDDRYFAGRGRTLTLRIGTRF
jgi:iron complex outermembrane receptor protein